MIIVKPRDRRLEISSLEENITDLEDEVYNINLAYVDPNSLNPIDFVPCGTSYTFLKEMIEWLNDQDFPALIWIYDSYLKRYDMPFFVNNNLCCAYEGFLKNKQPEEMHYMLSEMSREFEEKLDNFLNPATLWMVEKLTEYRDLIVFLNHKGEFTFIKSYSKYSDKGINYCKYGVALKPQKIPTRTIGFKIDISEPYAI